MNSATSDYSGRTVDLLLLKTILEVPAYGQRMGLDVSNVSGEPMAVTGVEKMVQRYALCFINSIGSTKFMPDHGTEIVDDVKSGRVYSMATLETAAAMANMSALDQVRAADLEEDTPDDERLVDAVVTGLEFSRRSSKVRISVTLTSAAGYSYEYVIPVAVGVR